MKRRYPFSLFIAGFIMNFLLRFFWLFVPGIVFLIMGAFSDWCTDVGAVMLIIDAALSFIVQFRIMQTILSETDDEEFGKFQDAISKEGNVFSNIRNYVSDAVESNRDPEKEQRINLVSNLGHGIAVKCKYGDAIEKLNEHERIIFITQSLEEEVNNGGFSQFFYNSSGNFSNELVDAFTKIGAFKTAEICKKAVAVFGRSIPTDRNEREELLDNLDVDSLLDECDDAFYEYEDDLVELNYTYIMEHSDFFD